MQNSLERQHVKHAHGQRDQTLPSEDVYYIVILFFSLSFFFSLLAGREFESFLFWA